MNILLLVDWSYPCDHQFLQTVYAENLVDRGHNITWVMRPDDPHQSEIVRHTWNGCDVYVLPQSAFNPAHNLARYGTGQIHRNRLFTTPIDFSQCDLVHVRNDIPMGLVALRLQDKYGLKFSHQISHLKSEALIENAKKGFSGKSATIKGEVGKRVQKHIAESADVVLPISDAMQEFLYHRGYTAPMYTLPTGAEVIESVSDGDEFKSQYDIESEFMLLYMGSMSPYRYLELLFDVLDQLSSTYDVHLVMAGGRFDDRRKRLKKKADEFGVSSQVTFPGWISDRDTVNQMVAAADIGYSPFPTQSILRTNAPIKTLEYMSLGTPVVSSDTLDQRQVLERSGAGFAVEHTADAFTDASDRILSSHNLQQEMSERGRNYIKNNRNFNELTDRTEKIYSALINNETVLLN